MANGLRLEEDARARTAAPAPSLRLPERDMRRKRPPLLSFLLRTETVRRLGRIVSLMALDFVGVYAAILTALVIKGAILGGLSFSAAMHETRHTVAFAYLLTVLLFARSSLYSGRAERPGLSRIVASLFQVTVVALIFALVIGQRFSSYYIFYGSLFFATVYVAGLRYGYERVTGAILRAAGYRRRTVLVGSGEQIEAVANALSSNGGHAIELVGYSSLTPRPACGISRRV